MITSVISSSRVFTRSYGAPRKLISCSDPSCVQEKSTRMYTCRLIECPLCRTRLGHIAELRNPLKGGGGRVGVSVSYIFKPLVYGKVP